MPGRLEGGGPFGPFRSALNTLGRAPSARNPNPGQTPAPGSQPRENRKAKFSGGKGSVAQWLACASSDSTVIPVRDTNSKMACCLVRSLGSGSMCFSWSAFVCLSQSHHAGFANTHTQAWKPYCDIIYPSSLFWLADFPMLAPATASHVWVVT